MLVAVATMSRAVTREPSPKAGDGAMGDDVIGHRAGTGERPVAVGDDLAVQGRDMLGRQIERPVLSLRLVRLTVTPRPSCAVVLPPVTVLALAAAPETRPPLPAIALAKLFVDPQGG